MKHPIRQHIHTRGALLSALSLCLALCLCLTLLPAMPVSAAAASFFEPELNKLVGWGVMNGYPDGTLQPDNPITRAEFVAMVNRAYGFTEVGPTPFTDVPANTWYADDIGIAYRAGYYQGTSATTASPNENLTREQAMVLIARNMRLDSVPGSIMEFSDSQDFSEWSRGYVKAAVQKGLIRGYGDGTFRPKNTITRGEMAAILTRALGTLVSNPGEHSLGDVYGSVTLSRPNTTLQDTTIAGDLYISGGLGLGGMTLDNVRVLGDIIVAGGGESDAGESVVLRNTTADALRLDSLGGQYLSLRAEGDTVIPETTVRSNAYLMDRTPTGEGLLNIALEGGDTLNLAGNLESVVNRTPDSTVLVAQGALKDLTIDETATGSRLTIDNGATVRNLQLDTGTPVTGEGDVDTLTVNTPGSTSDILPDEIDIRPGVTAGIAGTQMNNALARESSSDPRLLAGYPKVSNIAPTSATATFATNKVGTVYWAVSAVADGSISEDNLINPPTYASRIIRSGNLQAAASNTDYTANITGLTPGSDYYLAAIMTDTRGTRSPLKVLSFSTPDNSVPNFSGGTPRISLNDYSKASGLYRAQAEVIPTKNCQLYWALYSGGSQTPTAAEFRSGNLAGSLAHNMQAVTKNQVELVSLHNYYSELQEQTSYDLYLWLNDADNNLSSTVRKLTFTTVDGTPPSFVVKPTPNGNSAARTIPLTATADENCTLFWAAVLSGTDFPTPTSGNTLTEEQAQIQIANGIGAVSRGQVNMRANTPAPFNVTGLQAETSYDIWYILRDAAGNYSTFVKEGGDANYLTRSTLDNTPPTATQDFTRKTSDTTPYANTDIRIIFSENVKHVVSYDDTTEDLSNASPLDWYKDVQSSTSAAARTEARQKLARLLADMIQLHDTDSGAAEALAAREHNASDGNPVAGQDWYIDYWNATVQVDGKNLIVTFPTATDPARSALNLRSGSTYFFTLHNVADISGNAMRSADATLPQFTTISAQVQLRTINTTSVPDPDSNLDSEGNIRQIPIDMAFSMTPLSANVDDSVDFDVLFWSDTSVEFELYQLKNGVWSAVKRGSGNAPAVGSIINNTSGYVGLSLYRNFEGRSSNPPVAGSNGELVQTSYGIHFTKLGDVSEETGRDKSWDGTINFRVSVVTGSSSALGNLAMNISETTLAASKTTEGVSEIQSPNPFEMIKRFANQNAPVIDSGYPFFPTNGLTDTDASIRVRLDRAGTLYYVAAPVERTVTSSGTNYETGMGATLKGGTPINNDDTVNRVPEIPVGTDRVTPCELEAPTTYRIYNARAQGYGDDIKYGQMTLGTAYSTLNLTDLQPDTLYFLYLVTQGDGQVYSDAVVVYQFTTEEVYRPKLDLSQTVTSSVTVTSTNMDAIADYAIFLMDDLPDALKATLKSAMDEDSLKKYTEDFPAEAGDSTDASLYKNYPLWRALTTRPANLGGDSIYDRYAGVTSKDTIAALIRAGTPATGRINGSRNQQLVSGRTTSRTQTVDCVEEYDIEYVINYLFLAVARSTAAEDNVGGHSLGFGGWQPVFRRDTAQPKLLSITGNVAVTYAANSMTDYTMTGTITLTFDRSLYLYNRNTSTRTGITTGNLTNFHQANSGDNGDDATNANKTITITSGTASNAGDPVDMVTLTLTGAKEGNLYAVNRTLCGQYSSPRDNQPLTLTLHYDPDAQQVAVDVDYASEWYPSPNTRINTTVSGGPTAITNITLNTASIGLDVGESSTLTATLNNDSSVNGTVTWTVASGNIAEVVPNGKSATITGKASGTTTLTATAGGKTATVTVTVTPAVTALSFRTPTYNITVGQSQYIQVTIAPNNTQVIASHPVTWTSSDPTIVSVNDDGTSNVMITAHTEGTVTITATTKGQLPTSSPNRSASCTVNVTAAT